MYKKIVPFVFLVCGSLTSFGQAPTLTAANYNPQLNDAFISIVCDTLNVSPGLSGAGVTWNYGTGLSPTQVDTARDVAVASTTAGSIILLVQPSTNMAVVTPTASMTTYGIENSSKISTTGYYQSASQYADYTDPMDQIQFPCTYLSTFTDTYSGSLYLGGAPFPESGTVTSTCDGYGTLILPSGTYNNVLRVHSSQTYTDNANLFGTGSSTTFNVESYNWYMPNYHSALLTISTSQGTGPASIYYYKVVSYAAKQLSNAGVHNVSNSWADLQIYPNPVRGELNINFDAGTGSQLRISMYDMTGREVAVIANQFAFGTINETYNTTALPKGLYMVRVQSGDAAATRQVVVE